MFRILLILIFSAAHLHCDDTCNDPNPPFDFNYWLGQIEDIIVETFLAQALPDPNITEADLNRTMVESTLLRSPHYLTYLTFSMIADGKLDSVSLFYQDSQGKTVYNYQALGRLLLVNQTHYKSVTNDCVAQIVLMKELHHTKKMRHLMRRIMFDFLVKKLQLVENCSKMPSLGPDACPPYWDGIVCWPATSAGTTLLTACPAYVDSFYVTQNATITCSGDGSYPFQADYSNCTRLP